MKLRNILAIFAVIFALVLSSALVSCNGNEGDGEVTTTQAQNGPSDVTTTQPQDTDPDPDVTTTEDPDQTTVPEETETGLQGVVDDPDSPFGDVNVAD